LASAFEFLVNFQVAASLSPELSLCLVVLLAIWINPSLDFFAEVTPVLAFTPSRAFLVRPLEEG